MRRPLVESTTRPAAEIRARGVLEDDSSGNPQPETSREAFSNTGQGVGTSRIAGLDLLRGLAIALMIVDHVLVVIDPDHLARFTVTRLALPTFAIVTGYLWRPRWTWRYAHLIGAAFIADVAGGLIGNMGSPNILWLFLQGYVGLWAFDTIRREWDLPPLIPIAVAFLSWRWFPIGGLPEWWTGYHPSEVLTWMLLGRYLLTSDQVAKLSRLRWAEAIGRRPLTWYVGHLVAIATIVTLTTSDTPADVTVMAPGGGPPDVATATLAEVRSRGAPRSGVRLRPHETATVTPADLTATTPHLASEAGGLGARQGDPSLSTGQVPQNRTERRHADHRAAPSSHNDHCQQLARPKGRGSVHLGTRTATLKESGPRVHIARAADTDSRLGRHSRCHRTQAYLTPRA